VGGRGGSSKSKSDGQKTKLNNPKQQKTLEKIFSHPMPNNMRWDDIESFFKYLGYDKNNRGGSWVSFTKDGALPFFDHAPHSNQTPIDSIKRIKKYLESIEMKP